MKHLHFDMEEFSPIWIASLVQALFHHLSWWQRPPRAAFPAYGRYYDRVHVHSRGHDCGCGCARARARARGRGRGRVLKGHMSGLLGHICK